MGTHEQLGNDTSLSRDEVTIDGTDYRMYSDDEGEYPSVSTVLDARPTPEKDKSIEGWRNWLKGQPDRPDPGEVLDFKSWRGTLAHWAALDPLARRDLAGDEEVRAYDGLSGWEYRHDDALTQAEDDVDWFVEQFRAIVEDWGIATFDGDGIVDSNVRAVERYVVDRDVGYAGQYDLAYEHPTRGTVVADLKTSKADSRRDLFDKKFPRYGMQLAAYARASSFDVDECHLIWIAPDTRESAIIPDSEWPETQGVYEAQFIGHATDLHQTVLDDYDCDSD